MEEGIGDNKGSIALITSRRDVSACTKVLLFPAWQVNDRTKVILQAKGQVNKVKEG